MVPGGADVWSDGHVFDVDTCRATWPDTLTARGPHFRLCGLTLSLLPQTPCPGCDF